MYRIIFLFLCIPALTLSAAPKTLYNSLDPLSIPQHLAFYENYPNTLEGREALEHAWKLLSGGKSSAGLLPLSTISTETLNSLINLINKPIYDNTPLLTESERALIDSLASHLPNRKLKGYYAKTEQEVIDLPTEEVDLSHGLFLTQMGDENWNTIRSYEAMIDLMALQLLTKISLNSQPIEKIQAISTLIFEEMGFRFPPHSIYAKDIDLYTFLPSVLDSRQGVCLGVSILYLSLAQRLNLDLEAVTPPGHIYVRWRDGENVRNIETTARGIHIDSEDYLGIETRDLETHSIKEVIGLAHINQASVYLHEQQYETALASYLKAKPYLVDHAQLKELLGYTYVLTGDPAKGKELLEQVQGYIPPHAVTSSSLVDDYLNGFVDADGIQVLFQRVDENRASIIEKKEALESIIAKYPKFRDGWRALATTWLQLHRSKEALRYLQACHQLDPTDPSIEYFLSAIYTQRLEYDNAWQHLVESEQLVNNFDHHPNALKELRRYLSFQYPTK